MTSRSARYGVPGKGGFVSRSKRRVSSLGKTGSVGVTSKAQPSNGKRIVMANGQYIVLGANNQIIESGINAGLYHPSSSAGVTRFKGGEVALRESRPSISSRSLSLNPAINTNAWRKIDPTKTVSDLDYIKLVREGVPAKTVADLVGNMNVSEDAYLTLVGMPATQFRRELGRNSRLKPELTQRYMALLNLVKQVQHMVEESGYAEKFDSAAWVANWLNAPLPALGNKPPAEFMDTAKGQEMVAKLLKQIQAGVYA